MNSDCTLYFVLASSPTRTQVVVELDGTGRIYLHATTVPTDWLHPDYILKHVLQ